jgi:hypothetical protein
MKEQSLIHIKIDYEDAIQSKKNLLSSERDLIRVLKIMKKYSLLRKEEFNTRLRMQNKIKELKTSLGRLNDVSPKIKIPSILRKNEIQKEKPLKQKKENKNEDLEIQLREIQERLRKLG